MKELSLNVLDITENSVKAGAKHIDIFLEEHDAVLTLTIVDDGCGMTEEVVRNVIDPFYTTRTTRKVGMGIPLLKLAAEQTGGTVQIVSRTQAAFPDNHGTTVTATFHTDHLDFTPIGDMIPTITTLIQGSPDIDFHFRHSTDGGTVELNTAEMREILGADVPLNSFEVIQWTQQYLEEQYQSVHLH